MVELSTSRLDSDLQILQSISDAFQHGITQRMERLRQARNSIQPVHLLPLELLTHILLQSLEGTLWEVSQLQLLASVCTLWWKVIISTPQFWSKVTTARDVSLKLTKSAGHPLIIDNDGRVEPHQFLHLLRSEIMKHAQRIKMLKYKTYDIRERMPFLDVDMPMLEDLELDMAFKGVDPVVNIRGCPRLRHLSVSALVIPWDSAVRSGLRLISIVSTRIGPPSPAQLFVILASCRQRVDPGRPRTGKWVARGTILATSRG